MLLAIAVGNSTTALGLWQDGQWLSQWRLASDEHRPADEYGLLVRGLFKRSGQDPRALDEVVIASVVPVLTPTFDTLAWQLVGVRPLWVIPGVRTGMAVRYDPPAALGVDRLLGAIAARDRWGAPVIVVDFGTATTINVVGADGSFAGGAIAPGVQSAAEALVDSGARLRSIDLVSREPVPLIGRTTEQSLRAGILYGSASMVAGLLGRISAELASRGEPQPVIVATGGMAGRVAPLVPIPILVPNLVLEGLRLVADQNRGPP